MVIVSLAEKAVEDVVLNKNANSKSLSLQNFIITSPLELSLHLCR
jgi:hypothetical protein